MKRILANTALVFFSIAVSFIILEITTRVLDGKPVLSFQNWILEKQHLLKTQGPMNQYDDLLGWRPVDDFHAGYYETGKLGLRYTEKAPPDPDNADILVVGDSFTAGSEVPDEQTWPAHLQQILGRKVLNGGVGAYGTDQIVLRGQRLMEMLRPKILVVGFLRNDIDRTGYQVYGGGPKPYFTIESEKLVHHNKPVRKTIPSTSKNGWIRHIFGHSYVFNKIMLVVSKDKWLAMHGAKWQQVENDPIMVTCMLLRQLKRKSHAIGTRPILLMQYGGTTIVQFEDPPIEAQLVLQCAQKAGIQVVSEFASLKKVAAKENAALQPYYKMHDEGKTWGHMSSLGNRHVANLVANAIKSPGKDIDVDEAKRNSVAVREPVVSDGVNLVNNAETMEKGGIGLANVEIEVVDSSANHGKTYFVKPTGSRAEHYMNTGVRISRKGPHTLSLWVDKSSTGFVRLQLLDSNTSGVMADFDLDGGKTSMQRRTKGWINARIDAGDGNWRRLILSADLGVKQVYGIIQLLDGGYKLDFEPGDQGFKFRGLRLEYGEVPGK